MRIVIVGNSGSGKTWLGSRLAERSSAPFIALDEIFWQPGGFDQKRPEAERDAMIEAHLQAELWVAEGVFGSLASRFLDRADLLIWLDTPWAICRERLELRGSESKRHMDRPQSEEGTRQLIAWAEKYSERKGECSSAYHQRMCEQFSGQAFRLKAPHSVTGFLRGFSA
jgi:adenylate kinase family enzyme